MVEPIKSITAKELMEMSVSDAITEDVKLGKHPTWISEEGRAMVRRDLEQDIQSDCYTPDINGITCDYNDLKDWIKTNLIPIATIYQSGSTSYRLKHLFESSPKGYYVTNNTFKAAMIDCGFWYLKKQQFEACDQTGNLYFNISKKSPAFDYYK